MVKSFGFKLKINGRHIANAGVDTAHYTVIGYSTFVQGNDGRNTCKFNMSGSDIDEGENLDWHGADLNLGDLITLEVINAPFDAPQHKYKYGEETSTEDVLKRKLEEYYSLKEELKDHIK